MTGNPLKDPPATSKLTLMRAVAKGQGGLAVEVDVGEHVVRSDLPVPRGGTNTAPAPGHLMRAAVAACLAIGYKTAGAENPAGWAGMSRQPATGWSIRTPPPAGQAGHPF